jgi:hypothetical protein
MPLSRKKNEQVRFMQTPFTERPEALLRHDPAAFQDIPVELKRFGAPIQDTSTAAQKQ